MKNFLRVFFLLIAIVSGIGLVIIGIYYVNRNISSIKKLFQSLNEMLEDGNVENKELADVKDEAVAIVKNIEEDVSSDFVKVKKDVVKKINKVKKKFPEKEDEAFGSALSTRQRSIVNYFDTHSSAKMAEISKNFKNVTPRTLRRDLTKLEQLGVLRQEGKTRDAVYKLV